MNSNGQGSVDYKRQEEQAPDEVPTVSSQGLDNDQESHVSPSDNDGETVPQDEVVDQVGG